MILIRIFVIMLFIPSILLSQTGKTPFLTIQSGYNVSQHYGTKDQTQTYSVKTILRHGFTSGIGFVMPISNRFSIANEFHYTTKGSKENIRIAQIDGEELVKPAVMNVKYYIDYVEFPIVFNYKVINKDSYYLSVTNGLSMSLKVNGNYTLAGEIYFPEQDSFSVFNISDKSKLDDINMFDFSLIYGGEMGFRFMQIPLILSYRFTIGWDYLALPTYPTGGFAPVELRNQSYSLSLKVPLEVFN